MHRFCGLCFSSAAHAFDLVLGHVAEQQGQGRQLAAAGELHGDPLAGQVQLPHAGQPGQGRQVVRAVVLDLDRGQLRKRGDGSRQPGQNGAAAEVQGPQVGQRADLLRQVPQEACMLYSVCSCPATPKAGCGGCITESGNTGREAPALWMARCFSCVRLANFSGKPPWSDCLTSAAACGLNFKACSSMMSHRGKNLMLSAELACKMRSVAHQLLQSRQHFESVQLTGICQVDVVDGELP